MPATIFTCGRNKIRFITGIEIKISNSSHRFFVFKAVLAKPGTNPPNKPSHLSNLGRIQISKNTFPIKNPKQLVTARSTETSLLVI